VKTETIDTST